MNATKRKFTALLNSIGSQPPPSSSKAECRSQINPAFSQRGDLSKKRRVSELVNEAEKNKIDTTSLKTSINCKSLGSIATSEKLSSETPPTYSPWDRDEFLKRLKSFSNISNWTPKPASVNEVEWAKRGWICQKFERVRCCLCNVEIVVKLNRKEINGKEQPVYVAHIIEDALVEKYVELIITSHESSCLWRKRGCDDSIFKLPLNHPPTTIMNLKKRYEELKSCNEFLPYMHNLKIPDESNLENVLTLLPRDFFARESENPKGQSNNVNKVAFAMALFGWQGHQHERFGIHTNSVSCLACFRVLGLWMFKSKKVDEAGIEVLGAPMSCLDVIGEHRAYCPWRNAASQNGTINGNSSDSLPGWKLALKVIKNDSLLRNPTYSGISTSKKTDEKDRIKDIKGYRDEKDKEMRSRIMRVRSLFDTRIVKRDSRKFSRK